MVVIKNPTWDKWNPPPKTKLEKQWYEDHKELLKVAETENICPACKRKLLKNELLFDRGYQYGIECEYCK